MSKFIKYPSIENSYQQKHIDFWLVKHPELITASYVLQEKIHGSNIQLVFYPHGEFDVGSRTQILDWSDSKGLFGLIEFLGSDVATNDVIKKMLQLSRDESAIIRLYGEFFGPSIQKGVDYGKTKRILFFDMSRDGKLYSVREMTAIFEKLHIESMLVPYVCSGVMVSLNVALYQANLSINHNSFVGPDKQIGTNLMEGCVIKPLDLTPVDINGAPFYLKLKNEAFKEKQKESKPVDKSIDDPEVLRLHSEFITYLTENRLQSVFSKLGEIQKPSQMSEYIKAFMNDAIEDFMKDHEEAFNKLSKSDGKIVLNGSKIVVPMLKKYLQK